MSEEITESAKALQEIAKSTGQAITVIDKLGQFFARVMKEPIDSACGMLADTLKFKRWQRQISLIEKAEKIIDQKQLSATFRPISPKLALPIFHSASIEDEESMHDIWAKLLVASLDPAMKTPRTAFVEIINQLEPLDVRILKQLFDLYNTERKAKEQRRGEGHTGYHKREPSNVRLSAFKFLRGLEIDDESYWAAVDNLQRLGLCRSYIEADSIETTQSDGDTAYVDVLSYHGGYDSLCITALGLDFVKICTYSDLAEQAAAPDAQKNRAPVSFVVGVK